MQSHENYFSAVVDSTKPQLKAGKTYHFPAPISNQYELHAHHHHTCKTSLPSVHPYFRFDPVATQPSKSSTIGTILSLGRLAERINCQRLIPEPVFDFAITAMTSRRA